jgi:branched-chain amino acid aminotransferase
MHAGTILEGVTRQSILDLARDWNEMKVTEGLFTMGQLQRALKEGRVIEMFGAGTAATISPIGQIKYKGRT